MPISPGVISSDWHSALNHQALLLAGLALMENYKKKISLKPYSNLSKNKDLHLIESPLFSSSQLSKHLVDKARQNKAPYTHKV